MRSTLSGPLDNQDSGRDGDDGSSNRQVEDDRRLFAGLTGRLVWSVYAGIHLSQDPSREERRVQRLLAVNRIETRLPGTLDIAKRAGQLYSSYLRKRGEGVRRILPDFLIGAHAEVYASRLVTWNPEDFRIYLSIEVRTPGEVIKDSEPPRRSEKGNLPKLKPFVREKHDREDPDT